MRYANYYQSSGLYHASFPLLMGTRLDILLLGDNGQQLELVCDDMEAELRRLEKMLNRFDEDSEVARVNSNAQFASVGLSDELWDILLDCRRYYELTDGYFDVTLSDFSKIVFEEEGHQILFDKYGLALDFGGYAKGYALRCVRKKIIDSGITRALVNFGNSSVLAIGTHPFGDSWPVGIEDPFGGGVLRAISLCDTSMSVSGNTPSNHRHIVDPATSTMVDGNAIVAVVSDDPVDAEVMTTAWIASGQEREPEWMGKFNLKNTYRLR